MCLSQKFYEASFLQPKHLKSLQRGQLLLHGLFGAFHDCKCCLISTKAPNAKFSQLPQREPVYLVLHLGRRERVLGSCRALPFPKSWIHVIRCPTVGAPLGPCAHLPCKHLVSTVFLRRAMNEGYVSVSVRYRGVAQAQTHDRKNIESANSREPT